MDLEDKLLDELHELNVVADRILIRLLELKKLTAQDGTLYAVIKKAQLVFESAVQEFGITQEDLDRMSSVQEVLDQTGGTDLSVIP